MIELRHLFLGQRKARDRIFAVSVINFDLLFKRAVVRIIREFPGDPRRLVDRAEKALECGHDAVWAFVRAPDDLTVFNDFFVRFAVVYDNKIG